MKWLPSREQRELMEQIKAGRGRLYRVAFAWCHDAALADDLAQEALTRGLSRLEQLRESAKLMSWLFAILNRCWIDHLRARRRDVDDELLSELPSDLPGPDSHAERQETVSRVRRAIEALPLGQRQVVTLVDLEGFSYAEVAEVLEIPIGTVMSRLCRARGSLRGLLMEGATAQPRLRSVK
ncbi:MAG: sigma-70 family RNA polymerase sigma factor [Burkholderiaceae bacterium]|nr:sigma-70 family RNA polymerase sigma factor [Sulfuritalea sp.]MCF8175609.1 sigma-70 family RNA polymerase sigma factor [Burkholderiaceae bacterium]MCF8184676.1 sigma-70 family RNA polymerase sigma factor [Polynucleobacter sp.]